MRRPLPAAILLFVLAIAGLMVFYLLPEAEAPVIDEDPDMVASLQSVEALGGVACPNPSWGACERIRFVFQITNLGDHIDMSSVILGFNTTDKGGSQETKREPDNQYLPAGATWNFTIEAVVSEGDRVQEVAFLDARPFYASNGREPAKLLAKVEIPDYTA